MIVNVDGYISEVPEGAVFLEFHSGDDNGGEYGGQRTAGTLIARDAAGETLEKKSIAAEFNLPQRPWWERLKDLVA